MQSITIIASLHHYNHCISSKSKQKTCEENWRKVEIMFSEREKRMLRKWNEHYRGRCLAEVCQRSSAARPREDSCCPATERVDTCQWESKFLTVVCWRFSTCNLILMSSHILVLSVKAGRAVHFSTSINFRLFRTFLLDPNRWKLMLNMLFIWEFIFDKIY